MRLRVGLQDTAAQAVNGTAETPKVNLSVTDVQIDSKITDSRGGDLKTLLKKVNGATNTDSDNLKLLTGKILEYAGFYLDVSNALQWDSTTPDRGNEVDLDNDPVSTTSQPNKSIDKLTFLIMFNLAYQAYEADPTGNSDVYGDPLVNDSNCWSYLANEVRHDFGMKRLNSAGEQVGNKNVSSSIPVAGWYPVNDSGVVVGEFNSNNEFVPFCNDAAYRYLGFPPENYLLDAHNSNGQLTNMGLPTPAQERTDLFDTSSDLNLIPLYFMLVAKSENGYDPKHWLNPNKNSNYYSRGPHLPHNVNGLRKAKRFIRPTTVWTGADPIVGCEIIKESAGTYYVFNGQNYYVELAHGEELAFYDLDLEGAIIEKESSGKYLAILPDAYDTCTASTSSGVTIGMGLDLGNSFKNLFKIYFSITVDRSNTTSTFNLFYQDKISEDLNVNTVTSNDIRDVITKFIGTSKGVDVEEDSSTSTTVTFIITIVRGGDSDANTDDDPYHAYNGKIYCPTGDLSSSHPAVTISPMDEIFRWTDHKNYKITDYKDRFEEIMNYSFSSNPPSGNNDYWLEQSGFSSTEIAFIKLKVKMLFGIRKVPPSVLFKTWREALMRIEMNSYVQHLRSIYYHHFRSPAYYGVIDRLVLGKTFSAAKPNQFELHFAASLQWWGKINSGKKAIIDAINMHNIEPLLKIRDEVFDPGRRGVINDTLLLENVKRNLYRNAIL